MITVDCRNLEGRVRVPLSKSLAHRWMICSFLAGRSFDINEKYGPLCDDLKATHRCLSALSDGGEVLDCGESGTTLRLLLPVTAAMGKAVTFRRQGSLVSRPIAELVDELNRHGACIEADGSDVSVRGRLSAGEYVLPGNISSQYVSALMLAFSAMEGECSLKLSSELESAPYVKMTEYVIREFAAADDPDILTDRLLEGDWSAGAMWHAADVLLDGSLDIEGLSEDTIQGDARIMELVDPDGGDRDLTVDVSDCPDIVPAIALAMLKASATLRITGAGRLRLKESDRLSALASILGRLGADVSEASYSLTLRGSNGRLLPGTDEVLDCRGDHRMIMFAALASIACEKPVKINDPEAVSKSYPGFFEEITRLGGRVEQI